MGNKYYIGTVTDLESLQHFGIKGQKWGVRRFQNPDGTLTEEGKKYYGQRTLSDVTKEYNRKLNVAKVKRSIGIGSTAFYPMGTVAAGITGNPAVAIAGMTGGALLATAGISMSDKAVKEFEEYAKKPAAKTNEILIKKGDTFVRTSLKQSEDPNNRIYVTYSKSKTSRKEYETTWGTILRRFAGDPDAKVYQNTYKADVDIVAPSLEKRKQAAEAIVNANKK